MRRRNRKAKRKEKKEKKKKRETVLREKMEEKEKGGKGKKEDFPGYGRLTFNNSSTKVGASSGIYVWTPKSWSYDKLQEVGYFPTRFIFSLKDL